MKYEWRKKEKKLYIPKETPEIVELESYKYILVEGEGNPSSAIFQQCTEALYALSYGIKMAPKNGVPIEGYFDYTVFPLEGIWNLNDVGKELYKKDDDITKLKDYFTFTLMIRQPDFLTEELFNSTMEKVFQKKKNEKILNCSLGLSNKESVCQCLHIGSYDDEPTTFLKMEEFCDSVGYSRTSKTHKEIYLSDPRRVASEKLKTTLRFLVDKK